MKVAIVGSRRYENKKKIKDFIFKLKQQYGEKTIIVSGGCKTGADKYAKKYALELGIHHFTNHIIYIAQCQSQDMENHITLETFMQETK